MHTIAYSVLFSIVNIINRWSELTSMFRHTPHPIARQTNTSEAIKILIQVSWPASLQKVVGESALFNIRRPLSLNTPSTRLPTLSAFVLCGPHSGECPLQLVHIREKSDVAEARYRREREEEEEEKECLHMVL